MDTNPQATLIAYIISNFVGVVFLLVAFKWPKIARVMFALLFGWACWFNYKTCHQQPEIYLDYSKKAISFYSDFITGWFSRHITPFVSTVAIGQGLIAAGMLLKGIWVKLACIGVIIFLISIAPLGYYAGFPFSLTVSVAAWFIIRKDNANYLWNFHRKQ